MKIVQSIEALYEEQRVLNDLLKSQVDNVFSRIKSNSWHYFSRVKQLESFALKLETGRFSNPNSLEDFFACTIVVENLDQINRANSIIRQNFNVEYQRPNNARQTHKDPSSFQFDDLRLYAKLIQSDFLPEEPINQIVFEIQIKTFLQHAWSLATHDLIYKSDEINWSKERIAYQIKAMLEQAEVAISGVNSLINVPEVLKDNFESIQHKKILKFYKEFFSMEDLPNDIVRLCRNTDELLKAINLKTGELRQILKDENDQGRGTNFKNLSPFLLLIQSIVNQKPNVIETFFKNESQQKFKIVLPKELNVSSVSLGNEEKIIKI